MSATFVPDRLADLDVDVAGIDDDYTLQWDASNQRWAASGAVPAAIAAAEAAIAAAGAEAGAAAAAIASHEARADNPHAVTYAQVGAAPAAHGHDDRYYTKTQIDATLGGYSVVGHNHDDRYYTKSQIDTTFGSVAPAVHDHDDRYYTKTQVDTALAGYSVVGHAHSASDVTSGTLPVARGGTGAGTLTSGALVVGAGTSAVTTFGSAGGTTLACGTASGADGRVNSTSHATRGDLYLNHGTTRVRGSDGWVVAPSFQGSASVYLMAGSNAQSVILATPSNGLLEANTTRVTLSSTASDITYSFEHSTHTLEFRRQTSVQTQVAAKAVHEWADSADATRKGRLRLLAADASADREALRIQSSGTAALVGFFGAAAVARSAAIADATDAASVITQLNALLAYMRNLGLIAT